MSSYSAKLFDANIRSKYNIPETNIREYWNNIDNAENPILFRNDCRLMNSKKTSKYVFTRHHIPEFDKYGIFNNTERKNCCNVVSISLYILRNPDREFNAIKYLSSIALSIKNVAENLENWIVRLYTNLSINTTISESSEEEKLLNFILNHEIVEVYIYDCDSIESTDKNDSEKIPISRTRIYRFSPMYDDEVNVCAIREADGIVGKIDCHNLEIFSKSNKPFYLLDGIVQHSFFLDYSRVSMTLSTNAYSMWLTLYKLYHQTDFFGQHENIFDFLAGCTSIRKPIKKNVFVEHVRNLQEKVTTMNNLDLVQKNKIFDELHTGSTNLSETVSKYQIEEQQRHAVIDSFNNTGFDEMLLMEIFKDIISININDIPNLSKKTGKSIGSDVIDQRREQIKIVTNKCHELFFGIENIIVHENNDVIVMYEGELKFVGMYDDIPENYYDFFNKNIDIARIIEIYDTKLESRIDENWSMYVVDALASKHNIVSDKPFCIVGRYERHPKLDMKIFASSHIIANTPAMKSSYDVIFNIGMMYEMINKITRESMEPPERHMEEQAGGLMKYRYLKNKYILLKNNCK